MMMRSIFSSLTALKISFSGRIRLTSSMTDLLIVKMSQPKTDDRQ
jgi:hypothetical protein